jgi:hypothetical protein
MKLKIQWNSPKRIYLSVRVTFYPLVQLPIQFHNYNKTAMYVYTNNKALSHNHYCRRKAVSVSYSEYVPVASSSMQSTRTVLCYHLWPVPLHHIFPHYLINNTTVEKHSSNNNVCFAFLYNFRLKHFSF